MASQRTLGHALHNELIEIHDLAENALTQSSLLSEQRAVLRRIQEVIDHVQRQLSQTRANLVPLVSLDSAATHAQAARNHLESFVATGSESNLVSANSSIDQVLIQIGALPALPYKVHASTLAKAVDDYAVRLNTNEAAVFAGMEDLKVLIQQERESIDAKLQESRQQFDASVEELQRKLTDIEAESAKLFSEVTTSATANLEDLRGDIKIESDRLSALRTQQETLFSAAQDKRVRRRDGLAQNNF